MNLARNFVENFPCFSIVLCMAAGILSTPMKGKHARYVTLAAVTLVSFMSLWTLWHVMSAGSSFVYTMGRFPAPWGNEIRAGVLEALMASVFSLVMLFSLIGGRFGLSRKKDIPRWMKSGCFRYGFLIFFFAMFFLMLWNTWLVFAGTKSLGTAVTLLWTFKLPWHWAYHGTLFSDGVAQFAFGFYSVMLTSTVLGFLTMILFKPRSWCVYCPMGTMTQLICKAKNVTSSQKQ